MEQKAAPFNLSDEAASYLAKMVGDHGDAVLGVRLLVLDPGTSKAEVCLSFEKKNDPVDAGEIVEEFHFDALKVFVAQKHLVYLEDAVIGLAESRLSKQITINAPHSRAPKLDENSTLEQKIQYLLANEVNPALASHGGEVNLVDIKDGVAIVRFGGGCQGCSMVDMTLKQGVEQQIIDAFPEINEVRDITDHTDKDKAYA
jgi:Fe/S biogenesis protein NfuA